MGYEIKQICTIVPNPYHKSYKSDNDHYYFSLFITPRLQFDGTLKEFYEMLNWPEYCNRLFREIEPESLLGSVSLASKNSRFTANLFRDDSLTAKLFANMNESEKESSTLNAHELKDFLETGKWVWTKLFNKQMPVEAWPVAISPQDGDDREAAYINAIVNLKAEINLGSLVGDVIKDLDGSTLKIAREEAKTNPRLQKRLDEFDKAKSRVSFQKDKVDSAELQDDTYRQEFHVKISALSRYPHLLRILGLIHDFKISKVDFNTMFGSDSSGFMKFNVTLNGDIKDDDKEFPIAEFKKSVQFVCPYTHYQINEAGRLCAFSGLDERTGSSYDSLVKNGFLLSSTFVVDQAYYEDKPASFTDSKRDLSKSGSESLESQVTGIVNKTFTPEELKILNEKKKRPSQITKGFSIKVKGQPGDLLTDMDDVLNSLTDQDMIDGKVAFKAHHLDCGYRIDVKTINKGKEDVRSLSKREARYVVDRKSEHITIPLLNTQFTLFSDKKRLFKLLEDEPWLEETRQVASDKTKQRPPEIARWVGWSLSCPPYSVKKPKPDLVKDDLELEEVLPVKLPKLRFGKYIAYEFRIRIADICGNGPSLDDQTWTKDASINDNIVFRYGEYKRFEPLGSPLLFPPYLITKNIDEKNAENREKIIDERYKGEDSDTLVIRSKVNQDGEILPVNKNCKRFVTPQYRSYGFLEHAGLFELAEKRWLYKFLKAQPEFYYPQKDIEDGIPFGVDPAVTGVIISNEETNLKLPFRKNKHLPQLKPIILSLTPQSLICEYGAQRKTLFKLAAGEYLPLQIRSTAISADFSDSAKKPVLIIHAVQKPCFIKQKKPIKNDSISLSNLFKFSRKAVDVPINGSRTLVWMEKLYGVKETEQGFFPFTTTGRFILKGWYLDYELNPLNPNGWSYISQKFSAQPGDKPSAGLILGENGTIDDADRFYINASWSNLNETTPGDLLDTVLKDDLTIEKALNEKQFDAFSHTFSKTKFHAVNYQLEAESKYASYFDDEKHFFNGDQIHHQDRPFSVIADFKDQIIENTQKPTKPQINSSVLLFEISSEGKSSYVFDNSGVRIYLGNSWYETGLGERIALIHEAHSDTLKFDARGEPIVALDANNNILDSVYLKNKISIFASDPAAKGVSEDSLSREYIDPKLLHPVYLPNGDRDSTKKVNTYLFENDATSPGITPLGALPHVFSVLEVHWDIEKKEFYCDVMFAKNAIRSYSYLTKFAICRYQEHSIKSVGSFDYRFSDVVMSSMFPIKGRRKVEIKDRKTIHISGPEGYRFKKVKGQKEPIVNSFYLFIDDNQVSPGLVELKPIRICKLNHGVNQINKIRDFKGKSIKETDLRKAEIAEFENINLDTEFAMDESADSYNPRNDPRKHQVFFVPIDTFINGIKN